MTNFKKLILPVIISSGIVIITTGIDFLGDALRPVVGDFLTLPVVFFGMLLLPLAPIIYGLLTGDRIGSVIIGVIPVVGLFLDIYFSLIVSGEFISTKTFSYFGILAILGGLVGYFAARKEIEYNILSICCFLFWMVIFVRGIN
ncbi:hypothetical protein [Methanohalophilus portucalensis]|jgi:hypothetical protein|uniref:Uncharacterized protein n=2 Tax=Methanohalophilus portucalensis TaxID=39664 RepID=A0A1L9C5W5_9EURY|nr:hypothetical protein [Methanohalophilus portucalensis]ATU08470.1 hypothetical protein BKM01_06590 [Methanohalophilus portucalensis]OJH49818.1 hypothetical protein MPF_0606 [Methanohalophilus portucalensis FDF-1]RNI13362.1 hypothetical protein EFE41_01930 [Methanohalophilus portucalensis FDF-1]SMH33629.1 hypothetical protein SAMN06264941_0738 [Methanohalophilus portucalensis FDF-1]